MLTIVSFSHGFVSHFYDSQDTGVESQEPGADHPLFCVFLANSFSLDLHNEEADYTAIPSAFGIIPLAAIHAGQYNHFPIFCSAPCPPVVMEYL